MLPKTGPLPCGGWKPLGGRPPLAAGCGIGEGDADGLNILGFWEGVARLPPWF